MEVLIGIVFDSYFILDGLMSNRNNDDSSMMSNPYLRYAIFEPSKMIAYNPFLYI